jgi:hypothetical protein
MQLDTARVDLLSIVRLANYIAVIIGWLCFLFLLPDESNRPALVSDSIGKASFHQKYAGAEL